MQANVIELIFLLLAHAAAGIYSSTLKYSKKTRNSAHFAAVHAWFIEPICQ